MVSVMTTPTVTPSRSRSPDRSAAALASGSVGSSANSPESTLEPSTPAAACTRPIAFSVINVRPLRAKYPNGFGIDQLAPQRIPLLRIGWCVDDAALALGHHLAGDHDDVVVAQPRRGRRNGCGRGRRPGGTPAARAPEAARPRRADAVLGHGFTARRDPVRARTISAVACGSVISSGTDRTSTPSISAWSPSCTSQPSRMPTPERGP